MPNLDLNGFFGYLEPDWEDDLEYEEALSLGEKKMALDRNVLMYGKATLQAEKKAKEEKENAYKRSSFYFQMGNLLGILHNEKVRKDIIRDIQTGAIHEGYVTGLRDEIDRLIAESKGMTTPKKSQRRMKIGEE